MKRWLSRGVAISLAVLTLAAASVTGVAAADDRSLVPSSKLDDRPYRGIALVSVADRIGRVPASSSPRARS